MLVRVMYEMVSAASWRIGCTSVAIAVRAHGQLSAAGDETAKARAAGRSPSGHRSLGAQPGCPLWIAAQVAQQRGGRLGGKGGGVGEPA